MAPPARHHQRRRAVGARNQRVGAGLDEQPHRLGVGVLGGEEEGGRPEPVQPAALAVLHAVGGHPRVEVDPVRDQLADEVDAVDAPRRDRPGHPAARVRPPRAHRLVQRVPARAGRRRVRTPVEEAARQLPVGVGGGNHQRALPVGQGVVHVRPRIEQRLGRRNRAGADREEQRREPGRLRRPEVAPARPRLPRGANVNVRARLGQRPDRRRVVARRRPHQRRLAAHLVTPVRIGARRQKHPHRVGATRPRRRHQRRLAPR